MGKLLLYIGIIGCFFVPTAVHARTLLSAEDYLAPVKSEIAQVATPVTWGPDVRLTNTTSDSETPDIITDSAGNIFVFWTESGHIYLRKMTATGEIVTGDTAIVNPGTWGGPGSPQAAIDTQGNIDLVWSDGRDQLNATEVYYKKLDSNGNVLIDDKRLTNANGWSGAGLGMVVDPYDRVHVAWTDSRSGSWEVYYEKLDSDGTTMVNDKKIANGVFNENGITIDNGLVIHVMYSAPVAGKYHVFDQMVLYNGTLNGSPLLIPSASDQDDLATIYFDAPAFTIHIVRIGYMTDGQKGLVFYVMDRLGNQVTAPVELFRQGDGITDISIAVDSSHNSHIVWLDVEGGTYEQFYMQVDVSGTILQGPEQITNDPAYSSQTSMAQDTAGNLHLVWRDMRDGNSEIYYKGTAVWPARIYGTVTDSSSGSPIADTTVTLQQGGLIIDGMTTDATGQYSFMDITAGTYDVVYEKNGYLDQTASGIAVTESDQIVRDISLVPADSPNVYIDHIDVTQAVASDKLVADKFTYVRAFPGIDNLDHLNFVTATLTATKDGQPYPIEHELSLTDIRSSYSESERARSENAFDFRLGELPEGQYEFTVTINVPGWVNDVNPADNAATKAVNLVTIAGPKIIGVPIMYQGEGPDENQMQTADNLFKKIFPYSDYTFEPESGFELDMTCDPSAGDCFYETLSSRLGALLRAYNRMNSNEKADYIYGFGPKDALKEPGASWGNLQAIAMQTIGNKYLTGQLFSHELVHQYGLWPLRDPILGLSICQSCILEGTCYQVCENYQSFGLPGRAITEQEGPFDSELGITAFRDRRHWPTFTTWGNVNRRTIMGGTTNLDDNIPFYDSEEYWIERFDYEYIFDAEYAQQMTKSIQSILSGDYIDISGIIHQDDSVDLNPWYIDTGEYDTVPSDPEGEYAIRLLDGTTVLSEQKFNLSPAADAGDESLGPFAFYVPWQPDTDTVNILHDGQVIASRSLTAHAPSVTILSPNGGEAIGGQTTISWTGSDVDSDDLTYTLYYSADDGATWDVIVSDYVQSSYLWDTNSVGGCSVCRVMVEVSDGMLSATDMSDSSFAVDMKVPIARITDPADGGSLNESDLTVLQGYGYDPEDGYIDTANLSWTSDIDGALGTGDVLDAQLSTGTHTITLAATDSDSNVATDQIIVTVMADADSDGMPDEWETARGLNSSFDDSRLDPDQDGATNIDEYSADTDPLAWNPILRELPDRSIGERQTLRIAPSVISNPQANPVQYSIDSSLFAWDGQYFSWPISPTQSGYYTFTVTAEHNGDTDTETFTVTVNNTCRDFNKDLWKWDCELNIIQQPSEPQTNYY